jgi:hypothetical protein
MIPAMMLDKITTTTDVWVDWLLASGAGNLRIGVWAGW